MGERERGERKSPPPALPPPNVSIRNVTEKGINGLYTQFEKTLNASRALNSLDVNTINRVLLLLADETEAGIPAITAENEKDLALMDKTRSAVRPPSAHPGKNKKT